MANVAICLAGLQYSAKKEVSEEAKKIRFNVFSTGDLIRKKVINFFGELSFLNIMSYFQDVIWKDPLLPIRPILETKTKGYLLVDSIKSTRQSEALLDANYKVITYALWAPRPVRYKRLGMRTRKDDAKTIEDFNFRDSLELNFGLGSAIALADHMINASEQSRAVRSFRSLFKNVIK